MSFLVVLFFFGLATGVVGKIKGSSFLVWFLVGFCLPVVGLIAAIADAMLDSVPSVFLTGQVRTELMGTDGFQEADTVGITMPIVKHSFQVLDPREIPHMVHEAFHIARTGRPGPVLVDVPQDLSRADIPYDPSEASKIDLPGYTHFDEGNAKQIRLAAKALANARRPIIYAGGGVINGNAATEL